MDKKYLLDDKNTLKDHFIYVYSPRCQSFTEFDFEKDHCVNRENKDIDARFDYVSALNKEKVVAPVKISTECSFDSFGAPLIVIAQDICKTQIKLQEILDIVILALEVAKVWLCHMTCLWYDGNCEKKFK